MTVIKAIVEVHAEEAAYLWVHRDQHVHSPHFLLSDLAKLDNRVEAHLDALRIAGPAGWEIVKAQLEEGAGGETFAATVLSIESKEDDRIQTVLEFGIGSARRVRGLISGLGWIPYQDASRLVLAALNRKEPVFRRIAVAAAAIQRFSPGEGPLQTLLGDSDLSVQVRTAKAVGELGLTNLVPALSARLDAEDPAFRFAAAWSIGLLNGSPGALHQLRRFVEEGSLFATRAMQLAARRMPLDAANNWLSQLLQDKAQQRNVIIGAGATGEPRWLPFLLERMKEPPFARVAGESFTLITGLHLDNVKFRTTAPKDAATGPNDDPNDPNVDLDADSDLPWPNLDAVSKWWSAQKKQFADGTRYLLGKPIQPAWLTEALRIGRQRQRVAAALELAFSQPGKPLFEVRAPGFRQQQLLK